MAHPATTLAPPLKRRLFPLHLTPIELFMLADDRPAYPMTFVIQLRLAGRIDRQAFCAALDEALERHPLLRARIQAGKGDLPCWMPAADVEPELDWDAEGAPIVCRRGEPIDLGRQIGLRIWVRQGPTHVVVLFQFHHACCDGTGAYRFLGDLLAAYGIRTAGTAASPVLGSVDADLLRMRKHRTIGPAAARLVGLKRLALKHGWKILSARARPLLPPRKGATPDTPPFPGFLVASLDRSEHQQFRAAAGRHGGTPNDLLLRDLFLTLERWNRQNCLWPWGRRLRIMVPTDLRGGDDYEMPATNMTGYTFLTHPARHCAHPDELLRDIRRETGLIKHERSGTLFMDTIFAASRVRGLLPRVLASELCLATATLSNAGDPSRRFTSQFPRRSGRIVCGDLVLEEITGVPPLRHKTRVAVSISQYDRRLSISLRCDPHLFDLDGTAALLQLYVERLRESMAAKDPPIS